MSNKCIKCWVTAATIQMKRIVSSSSSLHQHRNNFSYSNRDLYMCSTDLQMPNKCHLYMCSPDLYSNTDLPFIYVQQHKWTWFTYQIFNMNHVGMGASCMMVLNIPSIVFVLLTCLLHQRQNTCKVGDKLACTRQQSVFSEKTYHLFGTLP